MIMRDDYDVVWSFVFIPYSAVNPCAAVNCKVISIQMQYEDWTIVTFWVVPRMRAWMARRQ
jgi:hypothetical protein